MRNTRKAAIGAAAIAAIVALPAAASAGNDSEEPIVGEALVTASRVALDHLGGGTVTDTEVGDEDSYYEVEVTLDGREHDVQLDEQFNVVSAAAESSPDDD